MIIAVDAAGGDYYPKNPVAGALAALDDRQDLQLVFVGPKDVITSELGEHQYPKDRVEVVDAPEVIGMHESPAQAVKTKTRSSIVTGLTLHSKGKANAFVSAGNTGALMAASAFILGRLEGVIRPSIATVYPNIRGMGLMIDVGANLEVKPEMLHQFGTMGEIYARKVMKIETPRVALLNVGEEEEKGTETLKEANKLLQSLPNFIGNVEGRDILYGNADVFVCDGYVGNILLKFGETIPPAFEHILLKEIERQQLASDQVSIISNLLKKAFEPFDYQRVGGVPFLGVNGVSLVGHGGSTTTAIKNMVLSAARMVDEKVNSKIVASLN